MCFSSDMIEPHEKSRVPQAVKCASCPRASWEAYRDAKTRGVQGKALKALIPPCEPSYRAVLIDNVYKLPLVFYARSTRRKPFETGFEKIARQIIMLQAAGKNPNIFDIRFKLTLKREQKGNFVYYVPEFSDVKAVTEEERLSFGDVYFSYINYRQNNAAQKQIVEAEADLAEANEALTAEMTTPEAQIKPLDGEYLKSTPDGDIVI
jgi:hypothetical protein